jgi:hypothetical protein
MELRKSAGGMRIYFDENFSPHLIAAFAALQDGRPREDIQVISIAEQFGKGCEDEVWIPGIAKQHGVAITQDTNIHRTRAQWALCQANKIGVFFLKPPKDGWGYWVIVGLVMQWWPEIKELTKTAKRPFGRVIQVSSRKWSEL